MKNITATESALIEFLSQIAESTSHNYEDLLAQFPTNENLQSDFGAFFKALMQNLNAK